MWVICHYKNQKEENKNYPTLNADCFILYIYFSDNRCIMIGNWGCVIKKDFFNFTILYLDHFLM